MVLIPDFEIGIWNAWIFMIWLIIFPFLSSIIIKDKQVSKRLRISVPMKYEKSLNIISTSAVIFGVIYSIFLPLKFNNILFYIGVIIFLFGYLFSLLILIAIRNVKTDEPFTKGPYKYSRHPIYLATILIILSISMMCLSWIFLIIAIICVIHEIIAAPVEEKYCLERYGKVYQDYINRTPRWFGFPKSERKQ